MPDDSPSHASPTQDDLTWITAQLGRTDATIQAIAARRPDGRASVIVNHPLLRQANRCVPFPTLYWLVCPNLSKAVSRLEMTGWIGKLEKRIADDPLLEAQVDADHTRYIAQRMSLLSEQDRHDATQHGFMQQLQTHGIAGIADRMRLKCLHAHVAHELADQNAIGKVALDALT